ncbi:hypothetical protein ACT3CD_00640 [Geofilum sp. OHC36d9]|uniref:hypothetical protein n=1 Tax=Geofilum sp. OHC36d9 TaxID=3458413 RepID=UPI004034EEB0
MKQLFFLLTTAFLLTACGSSGSKSKNTTETIPAETSEAVTVDTSKAINVDRLMKIAADNVDQEIVIKGVVTHVCKHSGKRCFLKDESTDTSIRIEAKGDIGGFNSELNGTRMVVKGFIREKRLSEKYINQWEQKTINQKEQAEIDQNQCSAELSNIKEMRDWMTANNKDFYSVFYVDGTNYKIVE